MAAQGRNAGLASLELGIKDCCVVAGEEWSPGHGMTASMKLDRKSIFKLHEKELDNMLRCDGVKEL